MAESDYRRLAASCHCGKPAKVKLAARGRPPKYCEEHTRPPRPSAKREIECPGCRGFFVSATSRQIYCSTVCLMRHKRGCKPRDEARSYACAQCGNGFESTYPKPMYCGKACKQKAWVLANPARASRPRTPRASTPPTLCAYWAGYCSDCSAPIGGKAKRERCSACAYRRGREAWRSSAEALHRAAGRVTACARCSLVFCPTYGASHATMCAPCSVEAARAVRRAGKAYRRAVERSAAAERVDPFVVFERDGWSCRMCGIATPKSKRGTYEPDAPELDHIKPLSKGGEHTYANTQCACRRCNGLKSDRFEVCAA